MTKEKLGEKIKKKIEESEDFKNISDYAEKTKIYLPNLTRVLKGERTDKGVLQNLRDNFNLEIKKVVMYEVVEK